MQQGYASIYKEFKGCAKVYALVVFPNQNMYLSYKYKWTPS